ncbi:MAG: hypothetical protein HOL22_00120 [Euryarchaeota archaeon]|nr:hypothetical protein [Euryarchaeota archaeon]
MTGSSSRRGALLLTLLMLFGGPLQTMLSEPSSVTEMPTFLEDEETILLAGTGDDAIIQLSGSGSYSELFTVEVPSNAPVTDIHLSMKPSVDVTQQGFVWDDNTIWSHSSTTNNGTFVLDNVLTGNGAGTLWDFNTNAAGWSFSNSYSSRVTSPGCGYNGSSGGSIRTYAGSTYATSPVNDFSGVSAMPLHVWVRQGSSSCGEEPDSNEDLKIQYRTASNTWTNLHTFSGSPTSSNTATQYMTNLPAAALHSNTQIRFHQTGGSGTCCDYWFVDDVHFATPPSAEWTSPTIGFAASSFQDVEQGPWAPIYLNAEVPTGANLNWTVLDGTTGNPISGMTGNGAGWIPLNGLDWHSVTSIRLNLFFEPSPNGQMASIHSISGDGQYAVSANYPQAFDGWSANGSSAYFVPSTDSYDGMVNDQFISPWFSASAALAEIYVDATTILSQAQIRTSPADNWTNITLPYSLNLLGSEGTVGAYQVQFVAASNSTTDVWQVFDFETGAYGGLQPAAPAIDFGQDSLFEWGGSDARVGSWGWQDRFENGQTSIAANPGIGGSSTVKAWIPATELSSFCFSALSSNGDLAALSLVHDGTIVANWTIESGSSYFILDQTQLAELNAAIAGTSSLVSALGTYFTEVEFEVFGSGNVTLAGLGIPYEASKSLIAPVDSSFVLEMNGARYGLPAIGGVHNIPLPITSETSGGLHISIEGLNTSSSVQLLNMNMHTDALILTPSQRWQTMETTFDVFSSSATTARLDVVGGGNSATWLLPLNGGSPIGTGDSALVELHPTSAVTSFESGTSITMNITFRIEPSWDDSDTIKASSRLLLANGVLSIPALYTWGGMGSQGFENDLEIKDVIFKDSYNIELEPTDYYLKAGSTVQIEIQIGFEGMNTDDAFADGDAIVEFYRGETLVANTTILDGNMWNITDNIPFTFGAMVWHFEVKPINGSGTTSAAVFTRTFHIDSITPQVLDVNMDRYDHRLPSTTQTIQIQISDQPILPQNIHAMVWREWIDDDNFNHWPDENEYHQVALYIPNNLTTLIGQYTLMMDDTGGSLGQKVSVYLAGSDNAGHPLENGGANISGEQLFMYQLAIDGPPTVASNAFSFDGGKKPWLHPEMSYVFDVDISEPNGGSDLATVVVELASNQGSDPLPIRWDFTTGNCTTTSPHVLIQECEMRGANGPADPFERDMSLHVELILAWTTPDLGETHREPGIHVIDRAGQEVFHAFPEHRWRFSAAMEIPEESVTLILSQGTLLGDGARLAPNSPLEVAGGVVFAETGLIPQFDCQINVLFAGSTTSASSLEGIWSVELQAPSTTMTIPMTWSVGCLEGQGVDVTNQETSVRWIIVDGTGPEPVEVSNPRPLSVLEAESHEVRVLLSEAGGLDIDSLELVWWVEEKATGDRLRDGVEPLSLIGTDISGLRLEVVGSMDLSEVTPEMLENRLSVHIVVTGRDLADNEVLGLGGTPAGTPVGVWDMVWLKPEFSLQGSSISYSRLLVEVGQTSIVTAYVENTGSLNGSVEVVFTEVHMDGNRSTLRRMTVEVPTGGGVPVSTDWNPSMPGLQWVEVQLELGSTSIGPSIDVRPQREESFTERVFGDVHPVLGTFAGLLFLSIVITGLVWARRMTLNRGSKLEYDWDEYSSEFEDDENYGEESHNTAVESEAAPAAAVENATASVEETDWVMGSDGYWWYHDKVTNEWWYKNAEGEIVQHN